MPFTHAASLALVAVNLLPLAGVMWWGWSVFEIMTLYWLENVVIGVINVLRMLAVMVLRRAAGTVVLIPFFCLHYGLFTLVHGMFVLSMFGPRDAEGHVRGTDFMEDDFSFAAFWDDVIVKNGLTLPLAGLFFSHFVSWLIHFIIRGEWKAADLSQLMSAPYGRVVLLHLAILGGAFAVEATGQAVWALLLLVALKICVDLGLHVRSHRKMPSEQRQVH